MKKELIELYKELFFELPKTTPSLKTYAVIDSIRAKAMELKKLLLISNLDYVDLWHPQIEDNAEAVPLYLVELTKESEVFTYLLNNHEEKLATYFISPYDLKTFQRYYSRFTYPRIEIEEDDFREGVFGFYDPTILKDYLQTLYTQEKVDEFFAGIGYCFAPSYEDETRFYMGWRDKNGKLDDVSLLLKNLLELKEPSLDFSRVSLPSIANLNDYVDDRVIDHMQVKMFDDMNLTNFIKALFKEYENEGIGINLDEEEKVKRAYVLVEEAKKLELKTQAGLYWYVLLGLALPDPIKEFQFYVDLENASNELEKIEIMDSIWASMQLQKATQ
jgi:hypothetical protein